MDPQEDATAATERTGATSTPSRRRPRWSDAAWLAILAAIGVVQIVREQWFDAAVFLVTVLTLAADAVGVLPRVPTRRAVPRRWLIVGAGVIAVVMCVLPRHGQWMGVAVITGGVAAVVLAWPQPGATRAAPWSRGPKRLAIAWSTILVVGCLWELLQFILGRVEPRLQWFALSDLVDPVVASLPGRALFIAAWIAAGVFLVTRRSRP